MKRIVVITGLALFMTGALIGVQVGYNMRPSVPIGSPVNISEILNNSGVAQ